MSQRDVVGLSAVRSAIGNFNGALAGIEPAELAGTVMHPTPLRSTRRSASSPASLPNACRLASSP